MKKKTKRIIFFVIALFIISCAAFTTSRGEEGPWRGKVIDATTKQPIKGAVVVAVWGKNVLPAVILVPLIIMGGHGPGLVFGDAREVLTDKNGNFEIPAYRYWDSPFIKTVHAATPEFTIYKPGYGSFSHFQVSPTYTPRELFLGKGAVVELPKATTREERLKVFEDLSREGLEKLPILKKFINEERKYLGFSGEER